MADENKPQGEESPEEQQPGEGAPDESGLGNLPPLSDFESQTSDADLPPLSDFESQTSDAELPPLRSSDRGATPAGGDDDDEEDSYPGISDIEVETPQPTGGNIRPAPPGFESSQESDQHSSGSSPLDTPTQESGFQDLAADSDFSPETPDIGPGPGSDQGVDTPMFDSAFGGGDFEPNMDTPAPTQAMQTPMFGADQQEGGAGFEPGAFGGAGDAGGGMEFEPGTPPPDFSPDTDIQGAQEPAPAQAPAARGGGKGINPIAVAVVLIAGLVGGVVLRSYVWNLPLLPDPQGARIEELQDQISSLQAQKARLERIEQDETGKVEVTQERLDELKDELSAVKDNLAAAEKKYQETDATLKDQRTALNAAEDDLAEINEEYGAARDVYTDLESETRIIQTRHRGLMAEVERLTGNVGELEEAAERRAAVKKGLLANLNTLMGTIEASIPLTPPDYSPEARLGRARSLRDRIEAAQWVSPELQQEFTDLQLQELRLTQATEYFFAKVPLQDQAGQQAVKWAECVLRGNWAVYVRSLDGKSIAIFKNAGTEEAPKWGFVYNLPKEQAKRVETEVFDARTPDFQERIAALVKDQVEKNATAQFVAESAAL